ncbi:unnamed protein product [Owenia fusiformis]|uniref:Uncharacterized protein n=1 Tax=Owenia fusiformis TaxID=6347 RepID=A0A8S4Q1S9_OWEFU|nr:unnamed protein product [Owenia fusiformis]
MIERENLAFKTGFLVTAEAGFCFLYGFDVATKFICLEDNEHIPCDVLRVNGKVAMLVTMFVISIVVLCLHLADVIHGIKKLKENDGPLLPVTGVPTRLRFNCERPPDPVEDIFRCENYTLLENKLEEQNVVVLTGPSGSEKTQLALLYAKKFINENNESKCFCFNSPSPEDLLVDVEKLIDQCKLNIHTDGEMHEEKNSRMAKKVWRLLIRIRDEVKEDNQKTLFVFDNATFETACIIKEVFLKVSSFIVIITTSENDKFIEGFEGLRMDVKGYTKKDVDVLALCQYDQFKDDMQCLAEKLDFLPLGIHAACQYMIESNSLNVRDLLAQLDRYGDPLTGLFQESYKKANEYCNNDNAKLLFNIVATLSLDPIPFDLLDWTIRVTSYREREDHIHESDITQKREHLLGEIKKFHLGTVEIRGSENKMLRMHNIPRSAIQKIWTEDERIKYFREMLLILDDQVDKDTRDKKDFLFFLKVIPHVKHALKSDFSGAQSQAVGIKILQISLQDKLHYMYTQTRLISYFRESESEAKELCYSLIDLKEEVKDIEKDWKYNDITSQKFIKKRAELINSKVKLLEIPRDFLKELVCIRRLNSDDVECLKRKMNSDNEEKSRKNKSDNVELLSSTKIKEGMELKPQSTLAPNGYLTETNYDELVQRGAAISLEIMKKVFLLEFMANILYTHGRMYFYKNKKNKEEANIYEHDLRLAYELSCIIQKQHDINIVMLLLAERTGFLYIDVDSNNKERIKHATERYKKLVDEQGEYYEKGLLKIVPRDDEYHQTRCRKQLFNCYLAAVTEAAAAEKAAKEAEEEANTHIEKQWTNNNGYKEAKKLLRSLENNDKADAYIKFGDLEMTLSEFGKTHLDKAIVDYKKTLKLEEAKSPSSRKGGRIIKAISGITEALYKRKNKGDWKRAKKYANRAIGICTTERMEKDTKEKLQGILDSMHSP